MKAQKKIKGIIAAILIAMVSLTAVAQENENDKRFGFELSSGASFATTEPGDAKLNTGVGFEGIFHYRFLKHTGIYAGWGWNKFTADESFAGGDVDFEETGYVYGLQFKHPVKNASLSYYVRVGGLYNHIEVENEEGDIIGDTGHGLGWQLAGGIDIPLGSNWNFTPGVKYNALSGDLEINGTTTELDQNYLMVRVGFLKKF